ncbi:uncharacterized protein EI90DRAFT_1853485 [Cantharellus anzutake]|uniref:uncharacterized protein n=1 Tax=Cantharellus anzutake TaxID=1750568 RepID=UPI001906F8F0|nr:uncharacterized protein EI90DRAFT_1853485 [Cantharellus anzutake]KAF8326980.1 hypothetical protein EI90DRAFT_1853485 [Cantharellus anzutake]
MDKINLTRKVSDGGYKLLASQGAKISHDDLLHVARSRGIIRPSTSSMEALSIISDLISDSLKDREDEIVRKASKFLSCFAQDASWATSTPESHFSVPFNHHDQTQGPKKPDGATPETVFLRQRFHNLRVEFRISNTGYEIRDALAQHGAKGQPLLLNSTWNLFLRAGKGASTAS